MCHRRSDWSRTSSRVGEPADETDDDRERADNRRRAPWSVRARERLAALVTTDERDAPEATPEAPSVDATGDVGDSDETEDAAETDDRRESEENEPIPADD